MDLELNTIIVYKSVDKIETHLIFVKDNYS